MLILWPLLWITFMVGLVLATIIAALRDKSRRAAAAKAAMPTQPMMAQNPQTGFNDPMGDPNAMGTDPFGNPAGDFGQYNQNTFK